MDIGQRQRGSLSAGVRHEGAVGLANVNRGTRIHPVVKLQHDRPAGQDLNGIAVVETASLLPNRFGVLSPLRTVMPMKLSIE